MASPQDHGQDQNMGWTSTGKAPTASATASSSSSFLDDGDSSDRPKTILIFVFAIAALLLIIGALVWRYHYIRKHHLPMRSFFTFTTGTKDRPPLPVHLASLTHPRSRTRSRLDSLTLTTLPVPPLAHPRSRRTSNPARNSARGRARTRGADIDVGGRRLPADGISEKDILPAYGEEAAGGRLPLYVELEAMDFGRSVGNDGGEVGTPTQDEPPVGEGLTPSSDVERQHGSEPTSHTEPPR